MLKRALRIFAMPPFVVLAAAALGGTVIACFAVREFRRINAELEAARLSRVAERVHADRPRQLRYDPETGTYRPD
jgi:hypothetical protein